MLKHGLFALVLALFLYVPAQAQELGSRAACNISEGEQQVTGRTPPNLIGRRISDFQNRFDFRQILVSGSEPRGTIVNQSPKPRERTFRNFLVLCVSAGNLPAPQSRAPVKCPDGTIMRPGETCPPPKRPRRCLDGSRVAADQRCPVDQPQLPPASPPVHQCRDGSVIPRDQRCPPPPELPPPVHQCRDGSVIPRDQRCPPPPALPPLGQLQRCADGNLIPVTQTCPREVKECSDGSVIYADENCPAEATPAPARKVCPDKSVVLVTDTCPVAHPPVTKCPEGSVAPVSGTCPPATTPTRKCADGSVVAVSAKCPPPTVPTKKCPGGSVVPDTESCPPPPCENGSIRNPATGRCEAPPCENGSVRNPATGRCEPLPPPPCDHGTLNPATGKCEPPCPQGSTFNLSTGQCTRACSDGSVAGPSATCSQPPVLVPELTGRTEQDAIDSLSQAGLVSTRKGWLESNAPRGTVVFTIPGAGSRVQQHSQIMYLLSAGPSPPPKFRLFLLIGIGAAAAIAAAAAWLVIPKRPRISVSLVGAPTTAVAWGEPIEPQVDVEMPPVTSKVEFPPYKDRSDE